MLAGTSPESPRDRLEAFRALAADLAPRDLQDLMSYPFFSLTKSKRVRPIDYHAGDITIRVEGTTEHGIATIWDADVLIWAASQIIEARDAGIETSRLLVATPYEILSFAGRGTSGRDYLRLKAALDRAYFGLTSGIARWLYRLARKHAGKQPDGWRFDFRHLHARSGSLARYADFALDLRRIARAGAILGYRIEIERSRRGAEILHFRAAPTHRIDRTVSELAARFRVGDKL